MTVLTNNANLYISAMWKRVAALTGGTNDKIESWWRTPNKNFSVNGVPVAPQDLLNSENWKIVHTYLVENVKGGYDNDIDFFEESRRLGILGDFKTQNNFKGDQMVIDGGTQYDYFDQTGGYRVHVLTSSQQIFVRKAGYIDFLIVGGGGGGGAGTSTIAGGGGGGGGVIQGSRFLDYGVYDIIIGSGGGAGTDTGDYRNSTNGGDTIAFSLTAYGGGAGSCPINAQITGEAKNGASGGGGSSQTITGGLRILGQGNNGGDGNSTYRVGGGGGGAGGSGATTYSIDGGDGSIVNAGNGGDGVLSYITGQSGAYYGGGGGGGATGNSASGYYPYGGRGGLGGGATARDAFNPGGGVNATANTGGGGAGGTNGTGGYGGSGIVVLRFKIQ